MQTIKFTSHYVSINSAIVHTQTIKSLANLHPTMYLLIHGLNVSRNLEKDNLHPTMYLLIPSVIDIPIMFCIFTSHYVSINSRNY